MPTGIGIFHVKNTYERGVTSSHQGYPRSLTSTWTDSLIIAAHKNFQIFSNVNFFRNTNTRTQMPIKSLEVHFSTLWYIIRCYFYQIFMVMGRFSQKCLQILSISSDVSFTFYMIFNHIRFGNGQILIEIETDPQAPSGPIKKKNVERNNIICKNVLNSNYYDYPPNIYSLLHCWHYVGCICLRGRGSIFIKYAFAFQPLLWPRPVHQGLH